MIHVIATITVKPGKRDAFLAAFRKVAPQVRAEAGCLAYEVAVDYPSGLGAQPPLREHVAVILEKWESLAALQAHLAAPHMAAYREETGPLRQDAQIQVLQPA